MRVHLRTVAAFLPTRKYTLWRRDRHLLFAAGAVPDAAVRQLLGAEVEVGELVRHLLIDILPAHSLSRGPTNQLKIPTIPAAPTSHFPWRINISVDQIIDFNIPRRVKFGQASFRL